MLEREYVNTGADAKKNIFMGSDAMCAIALDTLLVATSSAGLSYRSRVWGDITTKK